MTAPVAWQITAFLIAQTHSALVLAAFVRISYQ